MVRISEPEETLWRQAAVIKRLEQTLQGLQAILAVLVQREPEQQVVITPQELMTLPSGTVIIRHDEPDGSMALSTHPKRAEDPVDYASRDTESAGGSP